MTNSISLSSDLNTLFLIEENQVVAFPLFSKNGILIGSIQNQLVAATNKGVIDKKSVKIDKVETSKSQIQFYYSDKLKQAFIIIIDIEANKNPDVAAPDYKYRALTYDLSRENIILQKTETHIIIFRVKRKAVIVKDDFTPFH